MFEEKTLFEGDVSGQNTRHFDWQLVLAVILAGVGLGAVIVGVYKLVYFSNQGCSSVVTVSKTAKSASASSALSFAEGYIYVDLSGAVKKPGLYQLAVGSRLATAIDQAGGFISQVDAKYVSQQLNLAQKLKDGQKIYIYSQAEREFEQTATEFCRDLSPAIVRSDLADSSVQAKEDLALVSLNQATTDELETLEGIGQKRATDIIANRPYQSLDQLVEKEVLTTSLFNKISSQLKL